MDYRKREAVYRSAIADLERLNEAAQRFGDCIGSDFSYLRQRLEEFCNDSRLKHDQRMSDLTKHCGDPRDVARVLHRAGESWTAISEFLGVAISTARAWGLSKDEKPTLSRRAENVLFEVIGFSEGGLPSREVIKQHLDEVFRHRNCGPRTRAEIQAHIAK